MKSIMDGETTLFVGGHYEITDPGAGQFITGFTYNLADLPARITYPDNEFVTFGYNNNMLPVSITQF